jgi:tetraprenyl-beta-curcumene synthase
MSTTIYAGERQARRRVSAIARRSTSPPATLARRRALPRALATTAARYLLLVLPAATHELDYWRARASEIPNLSLRRTAQESLVKRGNIEGAALFATLAPAASRAQALRALVAFQTAYNYLDTLSEQPSDSPLTNARQLHLALPSALLAGAPRRAADAPHRAPNDAQRDPSPSCLDFYAHSPERDDGGYLRGLLETCRGALAELPSYAAVASDAQAAAARIVEFQALNLSDADGGHAALHGWASRLAPPGGGRAWWETAAAAGSSLPVYALIAAAASPDLDSCQVDAIHSAYFPWIGALHSLLDSLVDRREDEAGGRRCLLDYYGSTTNAAAGLAGLAVQACNATRDLPRASAQRVIVTSMCSYYLSAPECRTAEAFAIDAALTEALGHELTATVALFRSKRLLHTLTNRAYT